jgi:hypothetical protein
MRREALGKYFSRYHPSFQGISGKFPYDKWLDATMFDQ